MTTPLKPDLIYASRDFRAAYLAETAREVALLEGRDWRRAKRIARKIFERERGPIRKLNPSQIDALRDVQHEHNIERKVPNLGVSEPDK